MVRGGRRGLRPTFSVFCESWKGRERESAHSASHRDVTTQNYKYFKMMERDGLDDLFLSDSDSEDDIEETLFIYAKPAMKNFGVSTGEKICSDCKGKVLDTKFIAEIQQCHQCFSTMINSDSDMDGFCSSVSSSSSQTSSGYTDNSAKSSPLNATKLELGKLS